jgi:Flp pilus assembly pilin Flp
MPLKQLKTIRRNIKTESRNMKNSRLLKAVLKFIKSEDGPTAVEYAIMLALLVGMMIASIGFFSDEFFALTKKNEDALKTALDN